MKEFHDTTICKNVGEIMIGRSYAWNDKCTEVSIKCIMEGMTIYLGRNKSKDNTVATVLLDQENKFHFGMWIEYIKEDNNNSWQLGVTFDEKDIDYENWSVAKYPDNQVLVGIVDDVCYSTYGAHYKFVPKDNNGQICQGSAQELFCICLDVVADYMRANVAVDPVMRMDPYFEATAKLQSDGSVYIEIEPLMMLKQHIKDDKKSTITEDASVA